MHSAKRYLVIALSFAVCMTVFASFAPRIAHAITATLVQVVNNSTNPVPTADSALRFAANVCSQGGVVGPASNQCNAGGNTFVVPTTASNGAAVKRLVIDYVSGFCSNYNNNSAVLKTLRIWGPPPPDVANSSNPIVYFVAIGPPYSYVNDNSWGPPLNGVPESDYSFSQATQIAFNAGDTVNVGVYAFLPSNVGLDYVCIDRLSGHLVTQ